MCPAPAQSSSTSPRGRSPSSWAAQADCLTVHARGRISRASYAIVNGPNCVSCTGGGSVPEAVMPPLDAERGDRAHAPASDRNDSSVAWVAQPTLAWCLQVSEQSTPPHDDKLDKGVLIIAGVVVLGAIMSILDITVVSVALQTFQQEFDATSAQVAWTMTGYTLALASVIPLTGWAADRFGTKRLYLLAVLLFTAGSVLCAAADSLEMLVAFRVLQGLGGGMLMPLGMTILTRAAGPERVGRVMAVLGIPMLLGPIFGPILGGWLIDAASWHWIFLINLPIGIAALIYAAIVLPKDHVEPSETFDWVGMLLLSPGLALFLYGVSTTPETGTLLGPRGPGAGAPRRRADRRLRAVGAAPEQHPPAGRAAAVQEPRHDRRGDRDVAVRDRVLRRQPAVPALLPAGPRRGRAERRPPAGPPGHRRDDHHADRRHPGRPDRPRQDRA